MMPTTKKKEGKKTVKEKKKVEEKKEVQKNIFPASR
jgi:hypothetical protein